MIKIKLFRLHSENGVGFTMIEIVIALFVLTVGVIGVYNAFSIMTVATTQMSDRFTAAYLTQEGIEIARNIRDNNWLAESQNPDLPWNCGLVGENANCIFNIDCSSGCEADYRTGISSGAGLTSYSSGGHYLYIDSNKFYSYNQNGTETRFKRKITINLVDDHTLRVTVTVFWDEKPTIANIDFPAQPGSITAEDYLYNWY
ncbi:MAG: hypothetical protein AAB777_03410 [Patescibacteria group bacterium]